MFDYSYIYRRQKNWIEHILRGDGLMRDVMDRRKNDGKEAKRQAKSRDDG